ncbi:MAG: hypothetical protein LBD07_02815 [Spirochaetaceae bacterium]|jgi:hypothetical protein|nr:hypothetical protein [Spirochaetaceae bacterium]
MKTQQKSLLRERMGRAAAAAFVCAVTALMIPACRVQGESADDQSGGKVPSYSTAYRVIIDESVEGKVSAGAYSSPKNASVELIVAAGFELDDGAALTVTGLNDDTDEIELTAVPETTNRFTFTMPAQDVVVHALFKPSVPMAQADGGVEPVYVNNGAAGDYDEVFVFRVNGSTNTYNLNLTRAPEENSVRIFMVAGGGGGGKSGGGDLPGSGGGAGGVVKIPNTTLLVGQYVITVGKGGTGGTIFSNSYTIDQTAGRSGGNSSISANNSPLWTALGGGNGGSHTGGNGGVGAPGGSGGGSYQGGGSGTWPKLNGVDGGKGTSGQGKDGGIHSGNSSAGGGGYKSAGLAAGYNAGSPNARGGQGIDKTDAEIAAILEGIVVTPALPDGYAGGGAGGGNNSTSSHGGGRRAIGSAHTGGGGGGGSSSNGYAGGSGIVVIRYKYQQPE